MKIFFDFFLNFLKVFNFKIRIYLQSLFRFFKLRKIDKNKGVDFFQYETPDLNSLGNQIKYKIKKKNIFIEALTHRSYSQNLLNSKMKSNERLEYLGDSVLNLIVGEYLFHTFLDAEEGKLTKIRSRLVNRKALFEYAKKIDLAKYLYMNPNAIISFPKGIESILADAFESLVAAIYLDGGYFASKSFISQFVLSDKKIINKSLIDDNYKSALLEYSQAQGLGSPRYEIINEEGPNHNPIFTVQVFIGNNAYGNGRGGNKKEAEQEAAKDALYKLSVI